MTKKRWVSIVNFIRYDEPRLPEMDLVEPVCEQMKLSQKYNLPTTWLMQPDAILAGPYPEFFDKELPQNHELGVWLEITRLHCDYAGVKFRGKDGINWDYHSQAALTIGYSQTDRIKLADAAMKIFKERFGLYPQTVAAWYIDAFTLEYLSDNYSLKASANCRDQWGTDGYSLWGGMWSGAYYPSSKNAMLPAVKTENQINVPIFRMLGSCPINQYDCKIGENGQDVFTLEPAYGPDRKWVAKLFSNMFDIIPGDYSFIQVGQENSFGWPRMCTSYELQMQMLDEYSRNGQIALATLGEIGKWYQDKYSVTASVGVVATKDPCPAKRQSFWYNSKHYRTNFILENNNLLLRDLHVYSDAYSETYLDAKCNTADMTADALPVVEGFLWKNILNAPCLQLEILDEEWQAPAINSVEATENDNTMCLHAKSDSIDYDWIFAEHSLECIFTNHQKWRLKMPYHKSVLKKINGHTLEFCYRKFNYKIHLEGIKKIIQNTDFLILESQENSIKIIAG
jgi:hypothetical protein